MIAIDDKELIHAFIETSAGLKAAITAQDLDAAKKKYQQLYAVYREINGSSLERVHKEVAYQQVVNGYHLVEDLKQGTTSPINIIAIALVIVILSTIIFINPRMIGLAVLDIVQNKAPVWNGEPEVITVSGETTIDFSPFFSDFEHDELVYFPIVPDGIKSSVSGSIVTFMPDAGISGQKEMELVVSDLKHSTKAKITLDIQ